MRDDYARHKPTGYRPRLSDANPWTIVYSGLGPEFESAWFPVYRDWMAVAEREFAGGTTGSSTSGVDLELKRKVIALAEEARAVLVSANTNLERK